jgi:MFS family permease
MVPNLRTVVRTVSTTGFVAEIREGLTWLWRDQVVKWIALTLMVMNGFGSPFFGLIMAVYAKDRWDDPRYLGLMLSSYSVGMLAGTTLYGSLGVRLSRRLLMVAFLCSVTIGYWPLVGNTPFPLILGCMIVGGLADGPVNPLLVTVRLERIPEAMRGRVFAATSAFAQLLPAATIPLTGLAIQQFGLRSTILALSVSALTVGIAIALNPVWAHMDDTRPR